MFSDSVLNLSLSQAESVVFFPLEADEVVCVSCALTLSPLQTSSWYGCYSPSTIYIERKGEKEEEAIWGKKSNKKKFEAVGKTIILSEYSNSNGS